MEEKGIHYRTGGKLTHAGCEMLPQGKDIPYIVIEKIEYLETTEVAGRSEKNVWIATFAKNQYTSLPMILNSTNRKRLAKQFTEVNGCINLLKNIPVRLTKETCKDAQDGGTTWGLRISKTPATIPQKETLEMGSEKTKLAKEFIDKGGRIEDIETKYKLTEEVKKWILGETKE